LIVSQFTLAGPVKKGRRPSFYSSEKPDVAKAMYEQFVDEVAKLGVHTQMGVFGAMMDVDIHNDGPVTFIIDSKEI